MKIYTNQDNFITLKHLITAEFSEKCIPLELVNVTDQRFQGPRRLPVLELDSGVQLFSSNIACLHIFPPKQEDAESVDKWLTWEAVKFQPAVVLFSNKQEHATQIESLLDELDSALSNSSYVVGDHITLADISIWVILYPFYTEEALKKQFLSARKKVLTWFEGLHQQKEFEEAEKKFAGQKGYTALKSLASACWYPSNSASTSDSAQPEPHSPSHKEKSELSEEDLKFAYEAWIKGSSARVKLKPITKPVLPDKTKKNVLITSALPYVNNVPHLGNIIGCVLSADVFARYCRARGWNALYICGTDEYGTATETKALEEGLTPQEICDKFFAIHRDIYSWFNISFDQFGRTTTNDQTEVVQSIFSKCHENGFTSTAEMDQLFCEKCQRFLADRFVEGTCPDCKFEDARGDQCDSCGHLINTVDLINPRCKQCQTTPVIRQSQQLFLELPKIESWLSAWVNKTSEGWTPNAQVITKSWLSKGLRPRCITRDLKWGVPVPLKGFENKVFYVWFDAPIGYMSITKGYTQDWLKWWKKDPKYDIKFYQFMAKDNVPFHSIMFPATIHASKENFVMLDHLMATEYLNYEDGKFSKSRGVGVFGNDAKETGIPSDIFRFYLLYIRPESQDSNFSWADFAMKVNSELLNNVGNFINRGLMFSDKFYGGCIPPMDLTDIEKKLLGDIRQDLKRFIAALNKAKLRDGIKYILNISRLGNLYIQSTKPWVLVKGSDDEKTRAGTIVGVACNMVGLITSLLQPYMPETVAALAKQLNLPLEHFSIEEEFHPYMETGHKIGKPFPLFTKIEPAVAESLKAKYGGRQKSQTPEKNLPDLKCAKPSIPSKISSKSQYETVIKSLEEGVAKQGDLVRSMKTAGKSKDELKPMIDTLLDLKKQLADLKADYEQAFQLNGGDAVEAVSDSCNASQLEQQVLTQAEKVRALKASEANKSIWQPEVNILLDLKKNLAEAQGVPLPATSSGKKKKNKK